MKAVLHVGPHKTGTTSLQAFLRINGERLFKQNVYIPKINSLDGTPNHWYLVHIGCRSLERAAAYHNSIRGGHDQASCQKLKSEYETLLRSCLAQYRNTEKQRGAPSKFVISTEEFTYLEQDEANTIYRLLLEFCDSVEVLYYYRSPFDRLRSDIQQGVKGGHILDHSILINLPCQDTIRICRLLPESDLQGSVKISIRPYMRDLDNAKDWDVRTDACDHLEIDQNELEIPLVDPGANKNISLEMFALMRKVNTLMPAINPKTGTYNKLRHHIHDAIDAYKWSKHDTPFHFFDKDIEALKANIDVFKAFLGFADSSPVIDLHPDCHKVIARSIGLQADAGSSGSVFDVEPELPTIYYANLLCQFWVHIHPENGKNKKT